MTAVFDYGAGNLRSVANTLESVQAPFRLVSDAAGLESATRIILPGVGHYGQLLRSLDHLQVRETLCARIAAGTPFLGICLGLQALFESSEEAPERGLGIYPGRVVRFPADARVPHMGWNRLAARGETRLLREIGAEPYVYFANSYYVPVSDSGGNAAALCSYAGKSFCAALERDNVFGVQFHPEKSGPVGQRIVRNFLAIEPC
ncbi:MAG: imidazole glycerol phosphate synthase subunit HisH [Bryobacterales bacterium]|nr:imidazole glycerol phosphate synthase subunit HisH [Bryobacterales bacterium]